MGRQMQFVTAKTQRCAVPRAAWSVASVLSGRVPSGSACGQSLFGDVNGCIRNRCSRFETAMSATLMTTMLMFDDVDDVLSSQHSTK
ncbi:hypothetical protein MRB53_040199 [Persea americana]|nr:hypothetical protein MRB53_040199 [Persea americana]